MSSASPLAFRFFESEKVKQLFPKKNFFYFFINFQIFFAFFFLNSLKINKLIKNLNLLINLTSSFSFVLYVIIFTISQIFSILYS